jgi:hypothetical protein
MGHLFPIAQHGPPVMGQKAHLIIAYFIQMAGRVSNGLIGHVEHLQNPQFASKPPPSVDILQRFRIGTKNI